MSQKHTQKIKCPKCGKEEEITVWDSINIAAEDPAVKESILNGSFFKFSCGCGFETVVIYPCLYHDMNKGLALYMVPKQAGEKIAEFSESMGIFPDNYVKRILVSPDDLAEKIIIYDAERDDRIIELYKLMMYSLQASANPVLMSYELRASRYYKDDNGERVYYFCDAVGENGEPAQESLGGEQFEMVFSDESYEKVKEMFGKYLPENGVEMVDMAWAQEIAERASSAYDAEADKNAEK